MTIAPLAPSDLLTLGGLAIIVTIVFKVVELALSLTPALKSRFGPLISIVIGIVLAEAAALSLGSDFFQAAITGLLAGTTASGLYDVATSSTSLRAPVE
jgi:hypothetical protein